MKHLRILRCVDGRRTGSIRKAADHLNVTASAVNRRIMDRDGSAAGWEPNQQRAVDVAGEIFVNYRQQNGDVERIKSQIRI
jgi:hypothetical protein